MTTPTLTLPADAYVQPGSRWKITPKVRTASFGGGYEQQSGDGINSSKRSYTITFIVITQTAAAAVEQFLEGRKGYLPFYFTLPHEASHRKWKCPTWSRYLDFKNRDTITAEFVEDFTP